MWMGSNKASGVQCWQPWGCQQPLGQILPLEVCEHLGDWMYSFFTHMAAQSWTISSCKAALAACGCHTMLHYSGVSDQGCVGAALDIWVIDFTVSLQKANLLISLSCSWVNVGVPCHVVCYCNSEIFCVCFFCKDLEMEGVWVSMDCFCPGYSNNRTFVRVELHPPVRLPTRLSLKVFFEFFAVIFSSEGEV